MSRAEKNVKGVIEMLYGYDSFEMCGNYEGGKFTKKKFQHRWKELSYC